MQKIIAKRIMDTKEGYKKLYEETKETEETKKCEANEDGKTIKINKPQPMKPCEGECCMIMMQMKSNITRGVVPIRTKEGAICQKCRDLKRIEQANEKAESNLT